MLYFLNYKQLSLTEEMSLENSKAKGWKDEESGQTGPCEPCQEGWVLSQGNGDQLNNFKRGNDMIQSYFRKIILEK